jgi:GNAT superfamily N-acetyltransferase
VRVRAREDADVPLVERVLGDENALRVARLGRLERPTDHPALVAVDDGGKLAGVLTYVEGEGEGEILTLHATRRWAGAGTALVEALKRHAQARDPPRELVRRPAARRAHPGDDPVNTLAYP